MTNKKHNYDWDAMGFDPDEGEIDLAFLWHETPQGGQWWLYNAFTPEGQAEFDRMKRLYAEDMAAETGPVRTVTRKEIVPGVYGVVDVASFATKEMAAVMIAQHWTKLDGSKDVGHACLSAKDLTDAIETLTQIRDALKESE